MKAGTIVAIGGGSIDRRVTVTTTAIDREAIRLTGKTRPNVLFLPTAKRDKPADMERFTQHYGGRLGCAVKPLYLYREPATESRNEPPRFLKSLTSEVTASIRRQAKELIASYRSRLIALFSQW